MVEKILDLIKEKNYREIKKELFDLNESDVAEIMEEIPNDELVKVFRLLYKDMAAQVFSQLPIDIEQSLITSLTNKEATEIIDNLYADDAADLLEEMPASVVSKLLAKCDIETRKNINHLLKYPDNSAGSIMTVEFISLNENNTVGDALKKIKNEGPDKETIDTCFVVNNSKILLGTIQIKHLLFANDNKLIKDLMDDEISVGTLADQEEVAKQFQKYDLTTMPVVDSDNRLVGVITIDDIVDIIEEETTEDMEKMAAISPSDKPYMKSSVFETWKKRIPWLLLLMISATFTGKIIQSYESALAACVVLTSFIPMLMDTGGNAGGQASVTIIRSLSLGEIEFNDALKVIWKELRVAILCGVTLAGANFLKMLFIDKVSITVALVVCLTLVATVVIAKLIGCFLPICAKKIGFDPAVMASPFITTVVDAISLITYFAIATSLLHI